MREAGGDERSAPRRLRDQLVRSRTRTAWLFLAPMLIVLGLVAAWPARARSGWASPTPTCCARAGKWAGLDNFTGKYGLFKTRVVARGQEHAVVHVLTVSIETVSAW